MATFKDMLAQGPKYDYGLFSKKGAVNDQEAMEVGLTNRALEYGRKAADMTPEERAFMQEQAARGAKADAGVDDEMTRLRQRGDDLSNVDEEYMNRAYQPAYERLMNDYNLMDDNILEDMTKRGIVSQGSSADNGTGVAGSTPEAYQRMLLARDTKDQLGRNMLEAQNQAVQQKLAQYQGRLAETNQANTRFDQNQAPVISSNMASGDAKLGARTGASTSKNTTDLGYASNMHKINSERQMAGQDRMLGGIGMGLNFTGDLANAAASMVGGGGGMSSDVNVKTDIREPASPDQALQDIDKLAVQKWKYKMGGGDHTGTMAQDVPADMTGDGQSIDVPSYLGKLTQAVQALNEKMSTYDRMLASQGGV